MGLNKKFLLIVAVILTAFIVNQGNISEFKKIGVVTAFPKALLVSLEPELTLSKFTKSTNTVKKVATKKTSKNTRKVRLIASRDEAIRFIWPARGRINSSFGERWGRTHEGIDIDGSTGDPVRASRDGVVTFVGWESGYGMLIVLDHAGPYKTKYGHLSKILVREGQRVETGDLIGLIGNTGRSTGSHLHFEILLNGNPVNPLKFLP